MVSEEIRLENDDTFDETSEELEDLVPKSKTRGTGKIYVHYQTFENSESFKQQLEQNSINQTKWSSNGTKKWKHFGIKPINDFLTYFNNQWCKSNNGWLEKYSVGIPSTSNALESFHDKNKKDELILPVTNKSKVKSSQEHQDQQVCPKCNTPILKRRYWYSVSPIL